VSIYPYYPATPHLLAKFQASIAELQRLDPIIQASIANANNHLVEMDDCLKNEVENSIDWIMV
jgi:hypothetical protein